MQPVPADVDANLETAERLAYAGAAAEWIVCCLVPKRNDGPRGVGLYPDGGAQPGVRVTVACVAAQAAG